ncbi:INO80 complex subunit D [Orussus abietinus]|nr:INO80 complex subunit D [Orussus abietinus]XP_012275971.1 INO80 complex subunit D [Orussus abietinus]
MSSLWMNYPMRGSNNVEYALEMFDVSCDARWNKGGPRQRKVKVPVLEKPNMDNKLKFSDRLKALLKTEARQDVDPYIFCEPEPFAAAAGRNFKTVPPKSARTTQNNRAVKDKGKCIKRRIKVEAVTEAADRGGGADGDSELEVAEGSGARSESRYSNLLRRKRRHLEVLRKLKSSRPSRDHTLLYYPRAGDEISDSESSGDETTVYQRHWFPGEPAAAPSRAARLSRLRSQLRRRLGQLHQSRPLSEGPLRERARCLLEAAAGDPLSTARALAEGPGSGISQNPAAEPSDDPLLAGGPCGARGCRQTSLPCTRHCSRHIMLNGDQLLFEHCTAKFSDNTQCCVPVFDVAHELPLCPEHARKRDNYHRKAQESKPKKARKKPASPTAPRPKPKSRPKKRKRPPSGKPETKGGGSIQGGESRYVDRVDSVEHHAKTLNNLNATQGSSGCQNLNLGLGLGSLGLGNLGGGLKVELGDHEVFASLDSAEHDFGNVLNNLPADAFNDLFIESRNGEYEPSREEEEELERALEAVDKDVRNLERMGQTHGLLEPALLAQLMSDIAS